jgi:hypothetical protein
LRLVWVVQQLVGQAAVVAVAIGLSLTPARARQLAAALIATADTIERASGLAKPVTR